MIIKFNLHLIWEKPTLQARDWTLSLSLRRLPITITVILKCVVNASFIINSTWSHKTHVYSSHLLHQTLYWSCKAVCMEQRPNIHIILSIIFYNVTKLKQVNMVLSLFECFKHDLSNKLNYNFYYPSVYFLLGTRYLQSVTLFTVNRRLSTE